MKPLSTTMILVLLDVIDFATFRGKPSELRTLRALGRRGLVDRVGDQWKPTSDATVWLHYNPRPVGIEVHEDAFDVDESGMT
jgi:hypothetical protein